ncbi:MAG: esterase, partial [Lachnospiraceae bacterium]|nr:esterase [Lachnospiraceae bacterium]
MKKLKIMKILEFGNIESNTVLIQPVDDHDLAVMDNEVSVLKKMAGDSFHLITVKINSWNNDLSPWKAPPV